MERGCESGDIVFVTYPDLNGACAAALLLLHYPNAQMLLTSRGEVYGNLSLITEKTPAQLHIYGLTFYTSSEEGLQWTLETLRRKGVQITWYPHPDRSRDYRHWFEQYCHFFPTSEDVPMIKSFFTHLYPYGTEEDLPNRILQIVTQTARLPYEYRRFKEEFGRLRDLVASAAWRWNNFRDHTAFFHLATSWPIWSGVSSPIILILAAKESQ